MATFEASALQCAAGIALDLLAAIASIESGLRPLAVRDGDKVIIAGSLGQGVAIAVGVTDQGREPGIGLMGLTPRQLSTAGLALQDGFDVCSSLKAAALHIQTAQANVASRGHSQATAERMAIRTWWRPESRFPTASAFDAAVAQERAQAAALAKRVIVAPSPHTSSANLKSVVPGAVGAEGPIKQSREPDCWDVFARQRAGLAQCDTSDVVASASTRPPTLQASPPVTIAPASTAR